MDRAYVFLTCLCIASAAFGETIMPSSPHRYDPWVDWAVFFAHVAAATAVVLFLWGLAQIVLRGFASMPGLVRAAWVGNGLLPIVSVLLTHSGGPFLYR